MIDEGKMTKAGLASFEQRTDYGKDFIEAKGPEGIALPAEMEDVIRANKKAWNNFTHLAPGYKKQYVGWLVTAKKPETRERRLKQLIGFLEENKKPGMK